MSLTDRKSQSEITCLTHLPTEAAHHGLSVTDSESAQPRV
jgi:hypothetical protein